MKIINTLKLDAKQNPYWSSMLMEGDSCVIETHSKTFNPNIDKDWRDYYDQINHRMALEMLKEKDRLAVVKMLLNDKVHTVNKPQDLN